MTNEQKQTNDSMDALMRKAREKFGSNYELILRHNLVPGNETEKAYCFGGASGGDDVYIPKSQILENEKALALPNWLGDEVRRDAIGRGHELQRST